LTFPILPHNSLRCRPKIALARTYEEALDVYDNYGDSLLGVISDVGYPRAGVYDGKAGLNFLSMMRSRHPLKPFILHSSNINNYTKARERGVEFLFKEDPEYSKTFAKRDDPKPIIMIYDISEMIMICDFQITQVECAARCISILYRRCDFEYYFDVNSGSPHLIFWILRYLVRIRGFLGNHMGFGDFVFRDPSTILMEQSEEAGDGGVGGGAAPPSILNIIYCWPPINGGIRK
jgi:hypothetical protein